MVTLAFLGANSQIATDFIRKIAPRAEHKFRLFSRRPLELSQQLSREKVSGDITYQPYDEFHAGKFDAIINFVGTGDPAKTAKVGGSIFEITYHFDSLALDYLARNSGTRYIFISSGAAYGPIFTKPAGADSYAEVAINNLAPSDFYSIAKMHAESRHRAYSDSQIIDIRIFNYFSRTTDLATRFLISDIIRAIYNKEILRVGEAPLRRDFLVPDDFAHLIDCVLRTTGVNLPLDAYSRSPVEKFELLEHMRVEFGLCYQTVRSPDVVQATGAKPEYFSTSRRASDLGYSPKYSSIEGITIETRSLLTSLGRL